MFLKRTTARSPIGLDLGRRWIKAVQLGKPLSVRPRVEAAVSFERLRQDNSESILDMDEARRLVEVLGRQGFVGRDLVLAVPGGRALTSVIEVPPVESRASIERIAAAELGHAHRQDPNSLEVACWPLPASSRATSARQVMAAACSRNDAEDLINIMESCGVVVLGLDLEAWAISRAVTRLWDQELGIVAAVDLGWEATTLVLLCEGIVFYERSLKNVGLQALSNTLKKEHGFKDEVFEYLLREVGFQTPGGNQPNDVRLLAAVRSHLDAHLDQIASEVHLATSYAQHEYREVGLKRLILLGGGAAIPGIADRFGSIVETKTTTIAPRDLFEFSNALKIGTESPALTIAAGLALYNEMEVA